MRTTKSVVTVAVVAVVVCVLAGCGSEPDVQEAAPVKLSIDGTPSDLRVGVIWTRSSRSGQGSDWRLNATGATVAEYRLSSLGGSTVKVIAVDDGGTSEGATSAVQALTEQGVSGIVATTAGSHLKGALTFASRGGIPVLLPYEPGAVPTGVWHTGPTAKQIAMKLNATMDAVGVERPALLVGRGRNGFGLKARSAFAVDAIETKELRDQLEKLTGATGEERTVEIDGFVIDAAPSTAAQLVAIAQEIAPDLPIIVPPDAASEGFASALDKAGGAVTSNLITVGVDSGDTAALAATDRGTSAAAFLTSVRLAAGSPSAKSLTGSAVAGTAPFADSASHDAVVSLVTAAAAAKSKGPGKVYAALRALELDASDGIAGPPLNFQSPNAVSDASVVTLRGSSQDPGLRPQMGDSLNFRRIFWFDASD